MIKIQNNTATREPIPVFLQGLAPESLADLSWTDPALGVQDCKWLPEDNQSPALNEYERYGDETLTIADGKVISTRAVVPWSAEEIAANIEAKRIQAIPASVSPRQIRQALTAASLRTSVESAVAAADQDTKDWYEFATAFERQHPMVIALATALGITERQLDDLFTLAGSL